MTKTIYMGQFDTCRKPDVLKTTLGSCVGVVLYDPDSDTFGMAHIMLPAAENKDPNQAGKYADTAIPALIARMGTPPQHASRLKAKVAGGANMFAGIAQSERDILKVGDRNIEATLGILKNLGIKVLGAELGGNHGRELTIDAETGKIWVKTIGQPAREF